MKQVIRQHTISVRNALAGLIYAFRSQPNFRIHFFLSLVVLVTAWVLQITRIEWAILVFTIVLGITGELLNTAVEAVTDLVTKEWRQEAKIAKDVAAGMMLFIAFSSIFVAGFIFLPYFSRWF